MKIKILIAIAVSITAGGVIVSTHLASAQTSLGNDVYLVSTDPVFSRVEIPGGFDGGGGYFPFSTINSFSSGYFVVNGYGNSNAFVTNFPRAAGRTFESGGMYLIRESDGEFLGVQNIVSATP